jgi:hypothetical protein
VLVVNRSGVVEEQADNLLNAAFLRTSSSSEVSEVGVSWALAP